LAELLTSGLVRAVFDAKLVLEHLTPAVLAENLSSALLWACIAEAAARAFDLGVTRDDSGATGERVASAVQKAAAVKSTAKESAIDDGAGSSTSAFAPQDRGSAGALSGPPPLGPRRKTGETEALEGDGGAPGALTRGRPLSGIRIDPSKVRAGTIVAQPDDVDRWDETAVAVSDEEIVEEPSSPPKTPRASARR
jgi:hypothetical protein